MRYFLDQDGSGHWYVIEEQFHEKWSEWRNLDENDERSWESPGFAVRVGGACTAVTFSSPAIFGTYIPGEGPKEKS